MVYLTRHALSSVHFSSALNHQYSIIIIQGLTLNSIATVCLHTPAPATFTDFGPTYNSNAPKMFSSSVMIEDVIINFHNFSCVHHMQPLLNYDLMQLDCEFFGSWEEKSDLKRYHVMTFVCVNMYFTLCFGKDCPHNV